MLETSKKFTEEKLNKLQEAITQALEGSDFKDDICVVVTGSYGRQEASEESDIDWYIIFDKDREASETIGKEIKIIKEEINKLVSNEHGDTGTFGAETIAKFSEMQTNIGGDNDTNQALTRRMLFLLEGTFLYNEEAFKRYRTELLKKYIKQIDSEDNIPRFLLNDIIRYYRTITTDFEHKVTEKDKDWGLRNIKLKFSRKLLYFSGIIAVAQLGNLEYERRINKADELFSSAPLERIKNIAGSDEAIVMYEEFLKRISNKENRDILKKVTKENRRDDKLYCELNDLSHLFSKALHELIKKNYPENEHPLQHALVF